MAANMLRSFYIYEKYHDFVMHLEYRDSKGISPAGFPQAGHLTISGAR